MRMRLLLLIAASLTCAACSSVPEKEPSNNANSTANNQTIVANNQNAATNGTTNNTTANNTNTNNVVLDGLDEPCDGIAAFTPRAVLDPVEDLPYEIEIAWTSAAGVDAEFSAGQLLLTYDEGEIVCTPHLSGPPNSGAADRPARIEISVTLRIQTEDGLFQEELPARLSGNEFLEGGIEFGTSIELDALNGSYWPPEASDLTNARIGFLGLATPEATQGNIVLQVAPGEQRALGSW